MKKFEFGLFALCVLVGSYFGSMFGIAVAICVFMTISGLVEEFAKHPHNKRGNEKKKEGDGNA